MREEKGYYLIGQDISGCKCGQGDHSVISYFVQTTRYIEKDMSWRCEQCCIGMNLGEATYAVKLFKFCPSCGRKITEFVEQADV